MLSFIPGTNSGMQECAFTQPTATLMRLGLGCRQQTHSLGKEAVGHHALHQRVLADEVVEEHRGDVCSDEVLQPVADPVMIVVEEVSEWLVLVLLRAAGNLPPEEWHSPA